MHAYLACPVYIRARGLCKARESVRGCPHPVHMLLKRSSSSRWVRLPSDAAQTRQVAQSATELSLKPYEFAPMHDYARNVSHRPMSPSARTARTAMLQPQLRTRGATDPALNAFALTFAFTFCTHSCTLISSIPANVAASHLLVVPLMVEYGPPYAAPGVFAVHKAYAKYSSPTPVNLEWP